MALLSYFRWNFIKVTLEVNLRSTHCTLFVHSSLRVFLQAVKIKHCYLCCGMSFFFLLNKINLYYVKHSLLRVSVCLACYNKIP